ncbi:MAG: hypothetical protein V7K14_30080 [Nostoc sp.]|uniref:hypothetical protein n=1 Tax=Nostoc sp. TaxID=1180 RepID=UPI002FF96844
MSDVYDKPLLYERLRQLVYATFLTIKILLPRQLPRLSVPRLSVEVASYDVHEAQKQYLPE